MPCITSSSFPGVTVAPVSGYYSTLMTNPLTCSVKVPLKNPVCPQDKSFNTYYGTSCENDGCSIECGGYCEPNPQNITCSGATTYDDCMARFPGVCDWYPKGGYCTINIGACTDIWTNLYDQLTCRAGQCTWVTS